MSIRVLGWDIRASRRSITSRTESTLAEFAQRVTEAFGFGSDDRGFFDQAMATAAGVISDVVRSVCAAEVRIDEGHAPDAWAIARAGKEECLSPADGLSVAVMLLNTMLTALTACVGLGIAWIIGAVALDASGSEPLRRDFQRSAILGELNQILPPSGPILHALARFDPLPSVRGPSADVAPPTRAILGSPAL